MKRYFFDFRDDDEPTRDDEGLELSTMEAVQEEAARSLADMARDASRRPHNGAGHQMAVEVRDDTGPVLQAKFTFHIERVKY